jgi:hypothetical protein
MHAAASRWRHCVTPRQCLTTNCTLVQVPQARRTVAFSNVDHRPVFQGLAIATHDPCVCWLVVQAFPKPQSCCGFHGAC